MSSLQQKYEKYNLFELIILLEKTGLESQYNKKAIIQTFVDNNVDVEYKKTKNEEYFQDVSEIDEMYRIQGDQIKWRVDHIRHDDYGIVVVDDDHHNSMSIMKIQENDIIRWNNKEYTVSLSLHQFLYKYEEDKYNTMYVTLIDEDTDQDTIITGQDFMDLLANEDVTYVKSLFLEWKKSIQ